METNYHNKYYIILIQYFQLPKAIINALVFVQRITKVYFRVGLRHGISFGREMR